MSISLVACILPVGLRLFLQSGSEALVLVLRDSVDLAVLLAIGEVLSG